MFQVIERPCPNLNRSYLKIEYLSGPFNGWRFNGEMTFDNKRTGLGTLISPEGIVFVCDWVEDNPVISYLSLPFQKGKLRLNRYNKDVDKSIPSNIRKELKTFPSNRLYAITYGNALRGIIIVPSFFGHSFEEYFLNLLINKDGDNIIFSGLGYVQNSPTDYAVGLFKKGRLIACSDAIICKDGCLFTGCIGDGGVPIKGTLNVFKGPGYFFTGTFHNGTPSNGYITKKCSVNDETVSVSLGFFNFVRVKDPDPDPDPDSDPDPDPDPDNKTYFENPVSFEYFVGKKIFRYKGFIDAENRKHGVGFLFTDTGNKIVGHWKNGEPSPRKGVNIFNEGGLVIYTGPIYDAHKIPSNFGNNGKHIISIEYEDAERYLKLSGMFTEYSLWHLRDIESGKLRGGVFAGLFYVPSNSEEKYVGEITIDNSSGKILYNGLGCQVLSSVSAPRARAITSGKFKDSCLEKHPQNVFLTQMPQFPNKNVAFKGLCENDNYIKGTIYFSDEPCYFTGTFLNNLPYKGIYTNTIFSFKVKIDAERMECTWEKKGYFECFGKFVFDKNCIPIMDGLCEIKIPLPMLTLPGRLLGEPIIEVPEYYRMVVKFVGGDIVSGKIFYPSGSIYEGQMSFNNNYYGIKRHGSGVMRYSSEDIPEEYQMMESSFKDGKPSVIPEQKNCCICLTPSIITKIPQCGHMSMCDSCFDIGSCPSCPICRAPITNISDVLIPEDTGFVTGYIEKNENFKIFRDKSGNDKVVAIRVYPLTCTIDYYPIGSLYQRCIECHIEEGSFFKDGLFYCESCIPHLDECLDKDTCTCKCVIRVY